MNQNNQVNTVTLNLEYYETLKEKSDAVDKNMVWHSISTNWNCSNLVKLYSVDETLKNITKDYKDKIKEEDDRNKLLQDYNKELMLKNSELQKEIDFLKNPLPKKPKGNFWRTICFWKKLK